MLNFLIALVVIVIITRIIINLAWMHFFFKGFQSEIAEYKKNKHKYHP